MAVAAALLVGCSGSEHAKFSSVGSAISGGAPAAETAGADTGQATTGAGGGGGDAAAAGTAAKAAAGSSPAPAPPVVGQPVSPAGPKIVRTGEVQLEVAKDALQAAYDRTVSIATAHGGFVADSTLATAAEPQGSTRTGRLVLRVPGGALDAVLAELGPVGRVLSTQLKGDDVSGQLVDLGARIQSLQSEESALRTLVGKANTVGEVLQVQGNLFDVRQQIEQLKAQQAGLDGAVAYATLTVGLREAVPGAAPAPAPPAPKPGVVRRSLDLAAHNTAAVATAIALTVGAATPVWVPAVLVAAAAWALSRRRRRSAAA
jgi:hypothetical protein